MRFEINDTVVSDERPGVGRVLRIKRGVGMLQVEWSKNGKSWHDDESLRRANVSETCSGVPAKATEGQTVREPISEFMVNRQNELPVDARTCDSLLGGQMARRR